MNADLGITRLVALLCVSFFLLQSFLLTRDYLEKETFIAPSKITLDEMPGPTIVVCDKVNSEGVASFAPIYTKNQNGTAVMPTHSKARIRMRT